MSDAVLAALITGALTLIGTILTVVISNRNNRALLEYRIGQLEAKQDKHNKVIERTYALEERAGVMEEKIKVANRRLDDLEHMGGFNHG